MVKIKVDCSILIILLGILVFFFPTSIHGNPLDSKSMIVLWGAGTVILLLLMYLNKMDRKLSIYTMILGGYLFAATYMIIFRNTYFRFSLARVAPIVCCLCVFTMNLKITYQERQRVLKFYRLVLNAIFAINIVLLLRATPIREFIIDFYTQYDQVITAHQISTGKPISFFGVHNIASFFYTAFFLICMECFYREKQKRYVYYMIGLFLCNLLLKSTTSFGFMCLMVLMVFTYTTKITRKKIWMFFGTVFIAVLFLFSPLFTAYISTLFSKTNGFIPRYVNGVQTLYKNNFIELSKNPLGIGFTISDSLEYPLYYTDSGYFIYLTMGNLCLLLGIYYLFKKYISKYMGGQKGLYLFLLYLLFDLGGISFLFFRTIFFLPFIIYLLAPTEVLDRKGSYE